MALLDAHQAMSISTGLTEGPAVDGQSMEPKNKGTVGASSDSNIRQALGRHFSRESETSY